MIKDLGIRRTFSELSATIVAVLALAQQAGAQGYPAVEAAGKMKVAEGLTVQLFAAEPEVRQPIVVKFDDRGRLWTVQYLQYPNPAGLKRVKVDRYSRTVYDRVPDPPPKGPKGDDRVTICEDSDGDGRADRFKDFATGLNLCTGLAFGHGGVYILQAPYLLFYSDRDRDDVPDGDPEVVLSGFGMDDSQSLANHPTWGPDGWLYGVTGSTTDNCVRGIEFQQAVWRFHPNTRAFELFCEGGGNLFGLTFDAEGGLFFSSNGNDLAYHGVQGAYYRKNFGKHGPLHNLHAYGYFEHLPYDRPVGGPRPGGTIYLGDALPERFRGALLCCDFLGHSASWWRLDRLGSTFRASYGGELLDSRDTWFCPPDLTQGPDGAIYLCDFHDRRTAHPDPDAEWDRRNGRIYRIGPLGTAPVLGLDLGRKTTAELVEHLRHPNGWFREQARVQLAARRDQSAWTALTTLARQADNPVLALQGLWALYASGGFDARLGVELLRHLVEAIRAWSVRLLGDEGEVSPDVAHHLARLAEVDPSATVRAQLASTARRLPGRDGLPIVEALLRRGADGGDPHIPLLIWWAIESRAMADTDRLLGVLGQRWSWEDPVAREDTLKLIRRYAADGTRAGYEASTRLLATAPTRFQSDALAALDLGLAERPVFLGGMGTAGLFDAAAPVRKAVVTPHRFEPLTKNLASAISAAWRASSNDPLRLRLAIRAGVPGAPAAAFSAASSRVTSPERRRLLLGLLADLGSPDAVPVALGLLEAGQPPDVQSAAIEVVDRQGDDRASATLLRLYPEAPASLRAKLRDVLLGKPTSARAFLKRVDAGAIEPSEVPVQQLRVVALHADPALDALVRKHWGSIRPGTPEEKLAEMRRLTNDLRAGRGDPARGKAQFTRLCAGCHTLFSEGGKLGPDLTGIARRDTAALLASIVDPGAVVRAPDLQYTVVTTSGRVVTGLHTAQDNAELTFVDASNHRTTLPRLSVEELGELPTSIMPEDLLKSLGPQDLRDLFAYLQAPGP
jgi:putative membrane-bound dehydrogenase-like protein